MALASPRQAFKDRPFVPLDWEKEGGCGEHRRMIAEAVQNILRAKLNNTGNVTLTPNQTTTTITSPLVEAESAIFLSPLTSTAAAENWYQGTIVPGQTIQIIHANSAVADRNFRYAIFT